MFRLALTALAALTLATLPLARPAGATACAGRDLIATLPAEARAALDARVAAVPHAEGLIWRAVRQTAAGAEVIHLVGTYHFADPRHAALLARVEPLIATATTLLVEAGPEEEANLLKAMSQRPEVLFITEGPTLPDLLPEADWTALSAAMRARGIPSFMAAKFRPWYVATLLSLPPCAMAQLQSGARGLDHQIMARATEAGIPVTALESFETLFTLFEGMTEADELGLIRATLAMEGAAADMSETLATAYFDEKPWIIWELSKDITAATQALTPAELATQIDLTETLLMATRNRAWIPALLDAAAQGEVLAAFGALHLPGNDGVLALLEAEGFTLTRLP